jgi:putative acetyltransferase
MKIRGYAAKDAAALMTLSRRSIEAIGPRDYAPQQVVAWAARVAPPERIHERATDGRTALVAVDDGDRPIGFIDLERDGHIDFLYCAPEAAGRGVASALYDALEARARGRGVGRLYAEASEAARRFFLKKGFRVTGRRAFAIGGVEIHNYAVEKALSDPGMV